jgi:hypothetical protein
MLFKYLMLLTLFSQFEIPYKYFGNEICQKLKEKALLDPRYLDEVVKVTVALTCTNVMPTLTTVCDFYTYKCDYDTHECDLQTHTHTTMRNGGN